MKNFSIKYIFILSLFVVFNCAYANNIKPSMFPMVPEISLLDNSIVSSVIFKNAPLPNVSVLDYRSREVPSNNKYSKYQIRLVRTKNKLTEYRTTEHTKGDATLLGFGVGYGGIISIGYLKKGDLFSHANYYKKYQWTHISNVKGKLFPLKVGNKLTFHYWDLDKNKKSVADSDAKQNHGRIIYRVIKVLNGYRNAHIKIPGKVYVITFSKSAGGSRQMLQNVYYFSQKLGWYIYAEYYFNNQLKVKYYLVDKKD